VLELCRIHDPGSVIFITDNLTDFYDNEKTGLHPDLQADIDALGECNFKRLHIFRGVAQFIESTCGPAVQRWEEVNKAFGRGERGGDVFRAGLFDFLSQELKNTIWNASVIGIYSTAAEIGVLDVRTLPYFELRPPYEVSNGELLVRVEAKVGIDFEGRIDRQLWHELRHVPPMHTVDSETFPSRVHFFGARVVPVEVYFTLNKATRVTSEYELVSLGGEPPIHPEEDE